MTVLAKTIKEKTIGQCWVSCVDYVRKYGQLHHDEDVGILEVLGLSVEIESPALVDDIVHAHGDETVTKRTLAKFSIGASMPDRPFTYGERIYDFAGTDQFEWLVDRLKAKAESKSATICLLVPGDQSPNLPCLTTIDAKIRNEALELQFFFRSQNIFGRQYANLLAIAELQHTLAARCSVGVGHLRGYIASAHIYEFDLPLAESLCLGEDVRISDKYYVNGPTSIRQ